MYSLRMPSIVKRKPNMRMTVQTIEPKPANGTPQMKKLAVKAMSAKTESTERTIPKIEISRRGT